MYGYLNIAPAISQNPYSVPSLSFSYFITDSKSSSKSSKLAISTLVES